MFFYLAFIKSNECPLTDLIILGGEMTLCETTGRAARQLLQVHGGARDGAIGALLGRVSGFGTACGNRVAARDARERYLLHPRLVASNGYP